METDYIVIGSGIAGSVIADRLSNSGIKVLVLDKARGSGGRLASKRLQADSGAQLTIDLGASHLKPKTAAFKHFLAEHQKRGTLASSDSAKEGRYLVPVGRSSALTRALLASAQTQFACRVVSIRERQEVESRYRWDVWYENEDGVQRASANHVILTAPPAQAEALLPKQHGFRSELEAIEMLPQWVSIVATKLPGTNSKGLVESLRQELEQQPEVDRVVLENDKPQRSYPDELSVFAIQFSSEWTLGHLDLEASEITGKARDLVRTALAHRSGEHTPELHWSACHSHRWLYAKPGQQSLIQDQFLDDGNGLSICGDYFGDPQVDGVERAFISASSLARSLIKAHELSGETADV